jgi:hypothetical protein
VCRNCHNLCTLKIPPAEFVKSRLLGAAAEAKFVREHKIYFVNTREFYNGISNFINTTLT